MLKPELLTPPPQCLLSLHSYRWWRPLEPTLPPPSPHPVGEQIPWPRDALLPGWLLPWTKPAPSRPCIVALVSPLAS